LPDLLKNLKIGSMVRRLDTSIRFYGKVLDQHGKLIEGAVVTVQVGRFDVMAPLFMGVQTVEVLTDQNGYFQIINVRGSDIFIKEISKDGHEFRYDMNSEYGFQYGGSGGETVFVPDKNSPVIFRMRKRLQDRTFLFEKPSSGIQVLAEDSGMLKGTDFIEGKRTRLPEDKVKHSLSEKCDLWYQVTYEEESGDWNVVLKPGGPNGGILVTDQKLYVAPEDGYQKEWSFEPVSRKNPKTNFVYLKSRSPAIFSRLEIYSVVVTDGFVRIRWKRATNPYGDRVLDAVDMENLSSHERLELKKRLKSEAQAALREGRLPERPKILALIEAAKRGAE